MNTKTLTKRIEKTRQEIWSYLMNNIGNEHWATLKRFHNRLSDNLEKLKTMKMTDEEMDSIRLHRKEALKVLKRIKKARKGKKYRLVAIDDHTWKEIEVKP
jgi:predicted GIY-YIG superfamily endonuclease